MSEIETLFPPQHYSSLFNLDTLVTEGDSSKGGSTSRRKKDVKERRLPLLDCLVSSTAVEDIDQPEIWKPIIGIRNNNNNTNKKNTNSNSGNNNGKTIRSPSPHNAFKKWRKANQYKFFTSLNSGGGGGSGKRTIDISRGKRGIEENNQRKDNEEEMSLLKFLAINALDLSLPASPVLLKSRTTNWFQLSGHPDSLAPAGPGTVWKKRSPNSDDTERIVYEELSQDPLLKDIVPKYYREVEYQGENFIELQDLLHGFQDPYVIDIKMGTRTFLESEVCKTAARSDLYQKMVAIDPNAPTQEEHECKAVTKLRYMQFRELQSSTCSQGFRIEAMKRRGQPPITDLKKVKSREEVLKTLEIFLADRCDDVRQRLLTRLCDIRSKIEQSDYFKTREVIGSSLFIIYDDTKVGVWLIDFAKTNKLSNGKTVDHRTPWVQGNHEEGLLYGFDRLISIIESINNPSVVQHDETTDKNHKKSATSMPATAAAAVRVKS